MDTNESELASARRDRAFLLRLLSLGEVENEGKFLEEALALCIDATQAEQGYLEISEYDDEPDGVQFSSSGLTREDVGTVRSRISTGIIAETLATGSLVSTDSARLDPRFDQQASVREGEIEGVLCAPVGGEMRLGILYLQKRPGGGGFGVDDCRLVESIAKHLTPYADRLLMRRHISQPADATKELRARYHLESIVGRSATLAHTLEQAMFAAPIDVTVLLSGASGTGKTMLARAIHANGPRSSEPFVELNCAAIPIDLFESELFGALKGSHSTASQDRTGKVAAAEGGTLFLDEVSEAPLLLQVKLLQLLQNREYYPLGASTPQRANIRVIAASNAALEERVADKSFREDLYFRLNVMPVEMPSLLERREDIPILAKALLERARKELRLPQMRFSLRALYAVESAEWVGNIRQLDNAIQAAAVRAAGSGLEEIGVSQLFPSADREADTAQTYQEATRSFQRNLLERTLNEVGGNVTEAAMRLDMARSYAYQLIQLFGLKRDGES